MKNIFQKLHILLRNCSEAIQRPFINYRQHRQWKHEREKRGYPCVTCNLPYSRDTSDMRADD
jgi:hypothetical protein